MKQAKDHIVFSLDVPSIKEARPLVELLSGYVGMFKVGLELFTRSGPEIIEFIKKRGDTRIFLDLKLHDIPATVSRAMANIARMGVALTTVHCGESKAMLEAAVSGSNDKVGVLGVTVLTSVLSGDLKNAGLKEAYWSDVSQLVLHRAAMAKAAGCAGVVCSGLEAKTLRGKFGKYFTLVTPGIRPRWDVPENDDQQRIATPAQAIMNGSDYIVIGRPIRDASNPTTAAVRIAKEIEAVI